MGWRASGWVKFAACDDLASWVDHVRPVALQMTRAPEHIKAWLRCGGTWFAGVNLLANDAQGRVGQGPALSGAAMRFIAAQYGTRPLDRAQLSVIYEGYPKPMAGETVAAFKFRRDRDAAHVDGLLPVGPDRRRHLQEPHAWVLGVPLNACHASPMVIWDGSHEIMRAAFAQGLAGIDPCDWRGVDLTDIYQTARKLCFETCPRVAITARPGESYLIHRLALHGVAPWDGPAVPEGRMIAYFRPQTDTVRDWL